MTLRKVSQRSLQMGASVRLDSTPGPRPMGKRGGRDGGERRKGEFENVRFLFLSEM